jgi:hypothetical protein
LILAMLSATHSENNRGASIPSLFSVLISEYLGLGSSTSPTWDRMVVSPNVCSLAEREQALRATIEGKFFP